MHIPHHSGHEFSNSLHLYVFFSVFTTAKSAIHCTFRHVSLLQSSARVLALPRVVFLASRSEHFEHAVVAVPVSAEVLYSPMAQAVQSPVPVSP